MTEPATPPRRALFVAMAITGAILGYFVGMLVAAFHALSASAGAVVGALCGGLLFAALGKDTAGRLTPRRRRFVTLLAGLLALAMSYGFLRIVLH